MTIMYVRLVNGYDASAGAVQTAETARERVPGIYGYGSPTKGVGNK
jgi:hypothetical protein